MITNFIKVITCTCENLCSKTENCYINYYAIIKKFTYTNIHAQDNIELKSIFQCQQTNTYTILDVKSQFSICFYLQVDDPYSIFVMKPSKIISVE